MAILRLENRTTFTDLTAITQQFSALGIGIGKLLLSEYLPQPQRSEDLQKLFGLDVLNLAQKQEIIQSLRPQATAMQYFGNCIHYDLIAVSLASPSLYQLLAEGSRPHVHAEDQVLYMLAGDCILGFSHPDGYLMELMLTAQEYIKVPAGIRHWFSLSATLDIKAVRYFTQTRQGFAQNRHDEYGFSCRSNE